MNSKKFFELAKAAGLSAAEVTLRKNYQLSMSIFRSEVSNYTLSDTASISARGIYNGFFGATHSEKDDATTPAYLVEQIKENAKVVERDEPAIIFPGSKKYKNRKTFNPAIEAISIDQKLANLFEIERKLKATDPRITEVESVDYSESASEVVMENSYGLKLKRKSNYFYYVASVVAKEGTDVKTGFKVFLSNKPEDFHIDKFVAEVAKDALSKLGGKPTKSKKYPTVINPEVTASLLDAYLSNASAESVQKKSSLFASKLHDVVASKKVTVLEAPLANNCFFTNFDDEGVATYNKPIIEKGVLKTFLYNLGTAAKDGVETTANGYSSGAKIGVSFVNPILKPGRKSEAELMSKIKEGLYLTDVAGLHSGLNASSGNFSLQASGFMIREGKIAEPVTLITVAGNLLELFKDIKEVGSNLELQLSSVSTPSILVKKLAVSGE